MRRPRLALPLAVCLTALAAVSQNLPAGFVEDTLVSTGLAKPNDFCFLPDGRCLIASANGAVAVYAATQLGQVGTVPAVVFGGEQGLLSVAADPNFPANGYVYVYYSSSADAFMHLDRFTCTGDLANPASTNLTFVPGSRRVILDALPNNSPYHNGGSLRFGPDGKLYLSTGDDSNDCAAQSLTSGCGCVVRLHVGSLPPGGSTLAPAFAALDPGDNPLSAASDFSRLVIAYGLRNPFRFDIDPFSGNLYIGDVGGDAVEEVSEYVYTPGNLQLVNFGWPWREGDIAGTGCTGAPPAGLVDPIRADHHTAGWLSVIGGPRYRNLGGQHDFGTTYEGSLFALDHWSGELRRFEPNAPAWTVAPPVPGQAQPLNWAFNLIHVSCLRIGPDGALWYASRYPNNGRIGRIRPASSVVSVLPVSGGGQRTPAGEPFAQPVVARVFDGAGLPLAGGAVAFSVSGAATLATTNPVLADPFGFAQTTVTSTGAGGPVRVLATNVATAASAAFDLFGRKLTVSNPPNQLVLQIDNDTSVWPPAVPYLLMLAFPGSPSPSTPIGPLCVDPTYALSLVFEDAIGAFGGISLSGLPAIGLPGLQRVYPLPPGLLTGHLMSFQALGFDLQTGWFRTNCAQVQF